MRHRGPSHYYPQPRIRSVPSVRVSKGRVWAILDLDNWPLSLGFVTLCASVTVSSLFFGFGSLPYYAGILGSTVLIFPSLIGVLLRPSNSDIVLIFLLICIIFASICHVFMLNYPSGYRSPLGDSLAKIWLAGLLIAATRVSRRDFCKICAWVAVAHVLVCAYGITQWSTLVVEDHARMQLGVGTAVWGEIALGTIVCGVLSRSRPLLLLSCIAAWPVLFATEMRGAGISAFVVLFTYSALSIEVVRKNMIKLLILVLVLMTTIFYGANEVIWSGISEVLLLDDKHRGIQSGFSGRFDNWGEGWRLFQGSPIYGVGLGDPVGQYTHNGFLQILVQYGFYVFVVYFAFILKSMFRSYANKEWHLFASTVCLVIFMVTAPRYLSFQIIPCISLLAAAVATSPIGNQIDLPPSRRTKVYARRFGVQR